MRKTSRHVGNVKPDSNLPSNINRYSLLRSCKCPSDLNPFLRHRIRKKNTLKKNIIHHDDDYMTKYPGCYNIMNQNFQVNKHSPKKKKDKIILPKNDDDNEKIKLDL